MEPDQFDLETDGPATPLLIILRNEDISSHICEVMKNVGGYNSASIKE